MALTIQNNQIDNAYSLYQRTSDLYKKNTKDRQTLPANQANKEAESVRTLTSKDLKSFLSNDEKKVLKEVFGDLSVDKESILLYNSPNSINLLKGSKIDIKL